MRILLSNDDGYFAPGLNILADYVAKMADVVIVAPERNRSGASNSLTLDRPLTVRKAHNGYFYVNGTPSRPTYQKTKLEAVKFVPLLGGTN